MLAVLQSTEELHNHELCFTKVVEDGRKKESTNKGDPKPR